MNTTFKVQSTSYKVQAPHATFETRDLTDEQRLQLRVNEVMQLANKKHAKPRLKGSSRVYPKAGAVISTADYVHRYFQQNANAYGSNKDKFDAEITAFFQPLTTHVSQPQGFDAYEVEA
jgi:hypothetical protein